MGEHLREVRGDDLARLRPGRLTHVGGRLYVTEASALNDGCICCLTPEGATLQIYEAGVGSDPEVCAFHHMLVVSSTASGTSGHGAHQSGSALVHTDVLWGI